MIFKPTEMEGSYVISISPIMDERGWFARTFCKDEFNEKGLNTEWVQMNHSFTKEKGTVRGMHFQKPPYAEVKLIRCIAGKVFDVMVDLRKNSATFLQWFGVELSAQNKKMIYIPEGFAHGFQSLEDDSELVYMHSKLYEKNAEGAIRYNDEKVHINWPYAVTNISKRDNEHSLLPENFEGLNI